MTGSHDEIPEIRGPALRSRLLLLVVALALLPRVLFLAETFGRVEFNYLIPGLDQHRFHQSALRIRAGDVLLADAPYAQGPLYPYTLAALYTLFPTDVRTVRIFQALLGVLTCVLVYLLALRWFPPWTAFACGALYSLYGFAIFLESTPLRASMVGLLYLFLLYSLLRYVEIPKTRWIVTAGLVFGLSITLRPNSVLLLPAFFPALAVRVPGAARSSRAWLVLGLFTLVPLLPVVMRNAWLGYPTLHMSSQGLGVFVAGNMPDARGVGWLVSEQGEALLREARGDTLRVLVGVAQAVARQPLDWLLVQLQKLHALFANYEIPNNLNYYLWSDHSRVLRWFTVGVHVIVALAIPGFVLGLRRRGERALLYASFLGVFLTIFPFYVIARFRLPMVGFLCLFAGFTIESLRRDVKARNIGRVAALAAGIALATVLTISPVRDRREPAAYAHLAGVYRDNGYNEEAIANYRMALRGRPKFKRAAEGLVVVYLDADRFDEAREEAVRHLELRPDNHEMQFLLARANVGLRQPAAAEKILVELTGGPFARRPDVHYELGRVRLERGDLEGALRSFREVNRLDPESGVADEEIRNLEKRLAL